MQSRLVFSWEKRQKKTTQKYEPFVRGRQGLLFLQDFFLYPFSALIFLSLPGGYNRLKLKNKKAENKKKTTKNRNCGKREIVDRRNLTPTFDGRWHSKTLLNPFLLKINPGFRHECLK